jgi:hypothetical protein
MIGKLEAKQVEAARVKPSTPVHAKTENLDGQKTKYKEKIRKIIIVGLWGVLRKKCILN